tara:strand:- start:7 stop:525 length:519 start_codon:yes stop_codon:yes gene_type:complete
MTKFLATAFLLLALSSCKKVEKIIDGYFETKRIERNCARVAIDLLDLQSRLATNINNKRNYFFNTIENEALRQYKVQSLKSNLQDTKDIMKLEQNIFDALKREPIISGCLNMISNASCSTRKPTLEMECNRSITRLYLIRKLLSSKIKKFFPTKYLEKIKLEQELIKNQFQN